MSFRKIIIERMAFFRFFFRNESDKNKNKKQKPYPSVDSGRMKSYPPIYVCLYMFTRRIVCVILNEKLIKCGNHRAWSKKIGNNVH